MKHYVVISPYINDDGEWAQGFEYQAPDDSVESLAAAIAIHMKVPDVAWQYDEDTRGEATGIYVPAYVGLLEKMEV